MVGSEPMPHNLGSEPTANITKGKGLLVGDGWAMIKRMLLGVEGEWCVID